MIFASVVTVGLVILGFCGYRLHARTSKITNVSNDTLQTSAINTNKNKPEITASPDITTTPSPKPTAPVVPSTKTPAATPAPAITPIQTPNPTPWVNNTNCLPQNPNQYESTYTGSTNSQYLQSNSYVYTTKLYAALQFAGLIEVINSKQYVVLAMDDSQWDSFTQSQLNWLNANPANMRSLIGWQIITSCITYGGVNPVKGMAANTTQILNTINGPVTFTAKTNNLGTFDSATVYIWDWFTSNGSVTIAGFVKPSVVP